MAILDKIIGEIYEKIDIKDINNKPKIVKTVRQEARITCRELGAILGLTIGQISDIEHGRLDVSDDIFSACFMICANKLIVQKEIKKLNHENLSQ